VNRLALLLGALHWLQQAERVCDHHRRGQLLSCVTQRR
jgi:hypothetical protein